MHNLAQIFSFNYTGYHDNMKLHKCSFCISSLTWFGIQQVFWFEITMSYIHVVKVFHCHTNLVHNLCCFCKQIPTNVYLFINFYLIVFFIFHDQSFTSFRKSPILTILSVLYSLKKFSTFHTEKIINRFLNRI